MESSSDLAIQRGVRFLAGEIQALRFLSGGLAEWLVERLVDAKVKFSRVPDFREPKTRELFHPED